MKIHSYNEWDKLREIVVGTATNAHWPINDPVFSKEGEKTSWKATPVPSGPVPQWVIDETNEDLDGLAKILETAGVRVHRPKDMDFVNRDGMYNYCPRDRLIIAGDRIIDPAMMYPCRDMEIEALDEVTSGNTVLSMPRDKGMVLDAANVCRLNNKWLYLESSSGNRAAAQWLAEQLPDIDIFGCNFYGGVHIDSTVAALKEGVIMLNASRVDDTNMPSFLKTWDKIWVRDCVEQDFYQYPYASKWIGMNVLSIDAQTVIVDATQTKLIQKLERKKFTVVPHVLRHSRTLGGGFHCVTLDTWRENV